MKGDKREVNTLGQDDALEARLAKLSPEKRRLLALMAKRQSPQPAAERGEDAVIREGRFHWADGKLKEKGEVRAFYNAISQQLNSSPFAEHSLFLNYGYVPNDNPSYAQVALPERYLNKNGVRLVLEVIGDAPLRPEHRVLDVGSGRGGTFTVLRRFFQVGTYVGVDLSAAAVGFCRRAHGQEHSYFMVGDAQHLPVASESFDAVINIESSHAYQDIFAFYSEVAAALRPGGYFLYTDLIPAAEKEAYERFLATRGLVLERCSDITSNVLLSCDETAMTHARAFRHENDPGIMAAFLGAPSSTLYEAMKSGEQKYLLYRFRKGTRVPALPASRFVENE